MPAKTGCNPNLIYLNVCQFTIMGLKSEQTGIGLYSQSLLSSLFWGCLTSSEVSNFIYKTHLLGFLGLLGSHTLSSTILGVMDASQVSPAIMAAPLQPPTVCCHPA